MTPAEVRDAECSREDPNLWSSRLPNELDYERRLTVAKAICDVCPVRAACYADALVQDAADGIWGGVMFVEGKVGGRHLTPPVRRNRFEEAAHWRGQGWSRTTIAEHMGITVKSVERMLQLDAAA